MRTRFKGKKYIEKWKDIPGLNGYQISSFGRFKSLSKMLWNGEVYFISKEKILVQVINPSGYLMLTIRSKSFLTNREVGKSFIKNKHNKETVNHIKGDKLDNRFWKLEWNTRSENLKHSHSSGQRKHLFRPVTQLTLEDKKIKHFKSGAEAQRKTGIFSSNIYDCVYGIRKTAGGYKWS